ncbi:MAG: hypothetical protein LUB59_01175, partial [Candidatus Gastranaerophilales bacterium]|nr:hypothetical protein [Candidatus Gastranaerophilales bacterium]
MYLENVEIINAYTTGTGSVINATAYNNNAITITDTTLTNNISCGLGGAIYSACDIYIYAISRDVLFTENKSEYNSSKYTWTTNSIYMANSINSGVTLNFTAYEGYAIYIYDGIDFDKTGLTININDGVNTGAVTLSGSLGTSVSKQLGSLNINGGTLSLVDGLFSNIFTNSINILTDTYYQFDVDVLSSVSDMLYPSNKYETVSDSKLILSQSSFNMLTYFSSDETDIQASVIRLVATNNPASAYFAFEGTDDDTVIYVFDDRNYYFTLGINGTIIISTQTPDNYLHPLVIAIRNTASNTYTMTSNNLLYNYGNTEANPTQNVIQSKKLTIKGNNYSIVSKEQLKGIEISGTDTLAVSKQQLVMSNLTMTGFKSAVINNGGKVTMTSVGFYANETDTDGSAIYNLSGTLTLTGTSRTYAQLYNNRSNIYGGAVYNAGTLTFKYVELGGVTDSSHGSYSNIAEYGGALANTGNATISYSSFDENIADELGGAIYNTSYLKLSTVAFNGNMSNYGGAVYSETTTSSNTLTTSSSTFTSNSAAQDGGAIYTTYNYTDTSSTFTENTAYNGGAVYKAVTEIENSILKLSKTKFYGNTAEECGGAIYITDGTLTVTSAVFGGTSKGYDGNSANYGGAIYNGTIATITSTNFTRNKSTTSGGAIYNTGTITLKKSKIGLKDSYGLYYGNDAIYGGGIYNLGVVSISSSTSFTSNSAIYGGGIYNGYIQSTLEAGVITVGSGTSFTYNTSVSGGAIFNSGAITITSATFTSNSAGNNSEYEYSGLGGAIYNTDIDDETASSLTITKSTFTSNSASTAGGAIYNNGSNGSITSSTFSKNISSSGGAVYNNSSDLILTSNKFTSNSASLSGGAIYNTGYITESKSTFTSNSAIYGGAIYNSESGTIAITSETFLTNTASISGGAIYNDGEMTITSSTFGKKKKYSYANSAMSGGAIYNTGTTSIISSTIYYNTAGLYAGAIYNTGDLYIEKSTISYNKITGSNGIGGAILNSLGTVYITGSTISSNSANIGGAIYNLGYLNISAYTSGKTTTKTTFSSNSGTTGGAIYNKGEMDIDNATFTSNSSTDAGGAILLSTSGSSDDSDTPALSASISNTTFSKNSSKNGGAIFVLGSSEYDNYVTISNSTFTSNKASSYGGAIYADTYTNVTIVDSDFKNNTASTAGGAIYVNGGATVSIIAQTKDVTFSGNKAGKVSNSIYLNSFEDGNGTVYEAILNLIAENGYTIYIKDNIDGNGTIYESGNVVISNRSTVSGITFKTYEGSSSSLIIQRESSLQDCSLELSDDSTVSIANNKVATLALKSLTISDGSTANISI